MPKTFHCRVEVRGYELDSFGHVNHAVYISYLEHARWKMLEEQGITLAKFNEWKRWPVIGGLEIKYLKPTFLGDELEIHTEVTEHGRTHFKIDHVITHAGAVVARAKVHAVMVNEKGRPDLMPEEVHRLWIEAEGRSSGESTVDPAAASEKSH